MRRTFLAILAAGFLFFFAGCNDGNPGTVPVSITITQKGTPVSGAVVTIISTDGKGNTAGGTTNSSGVATLETPPKWKGAMPGEYAVAVKKWERFEFPAPTPEYPNQMGSERRNVFPEQFGEYSTSGFTLTVGNKATTEKFDIDE